MRKPILVIGDIMLDRYIHGTVSRISPEAPVPILRATHTNEVLGGAANVAANLVSIGYEAALIGMVGLDTDGLVLTELLDYSGIRNETVSMLNYPTTVKTRFIGNHQQMLRVDSEETVDTQNIRHGILQRILDVDPCLVVISDYAKGFIDRWLMDSIKRRCRDLGIPLFVDPKPCNRDLYSGVNMLKPNLKEMQELSGYHGTDLDTLIRCGQKLCFDRNIDSVLLTLGDRGMVLIEEKNFMYVPTEAKDVYDVSGAGDTVMAVFAAMVSDERSLSDALMAANRAAGIVVGRQGTSTLSKEEFKSL